MKKRHNWGELKETEFTSTQQCIKCKIYRFKWLRIWLYTKENIIKNPFVNQCENDGCI